MNKFYFSEHENSLRQFLVNQLIKRLGIFEDRADTVKRKQSVLDPSANFGDVPLAPRFPPNH